jgi:hypothetical protein
VAIGTFGGLPPPCQVGNQASLSNANSLSGLFWQSNRVTLVFTTAHSVSAMPVQVSDFTVVGGGSIESVTRIGSTTPANYQVIAKLLCDGTATVMYKGNQAFNVQPALTTVVNANCVVRSITTESLGGVTADPGVGPAGL